MGRLMFGCLVCFLCSEAGLGQTVCMPLGAPLLLSLGLDIPTAGLLGLAVDLEGDGVQTVCMPWASVCGPLARREVGRVSREAWSWVVLVMSVLKKKKAEAG